jgi:hypothetical protein
MHMATRVLTLSLTIAPLSAQPPSPYQDLAIELAAKIAAALPSAQSATLSFITIDGVDSADMADRSSVTQAQAEIVRVLTARGVRIVERAPGAAAVRVSCLENLRERACVADIESGSTRQVVAATRPLDARTNRGAPLTLDMQSLFSQRAPILDVAFAGDRLVVLDPRAVTRYQRSDAGWQRAESQPIASSRVWPRDVRGKLRLDGGRLDVFLPGLVCRGTSDAARLACAPAGDVRQPWPLGIDNTGIEANRNYFLTPEGLPFFAAAPLGPDANARWLVAGSSGALVFLDESRRSVATVASGDDVAALSAACAGPAGPLENVGNVAKVGNVGSLVLVASSGRSAGPDTLRLFRAVHRQLIPAAGPVELPGRFTALWAAPDATSAIAVSHDAGADRHEAFHIRISCDR